jgi:hypothetical protein
MPYPLIVVFWVVSIFFGIAEAVFTGHVWPLAQTYPALGFLGYINGVGYPLES